MSLEQTPDVTPPDESPEPSPQDEGWLRLDKRKLLLDPIGAVRSAIFPIAAVIFGVSSLDGIWWVLAAPVVVTVIALFGLIPWFTTTYRITATQFQMRKGLLNKSTSTAPLDRIRSVDLEATVLHRLLGMRKVQIGTGVDSERIELDAVTTERADELRAQLLTARLASTNATVPASPVDPTDPAVLAAPSALAAPSVLADPAAADESYDGPVSAPPTPSAPPSTEQVLARFDWTWVRFAPFNFARLAVIAAAIGVLSQFAGDIDVDYAEIAESTRAALRIGVVVLSVVIALSLLVGWLIISMGGYMVQWWALRLTRDAGILRMSAGLLTTRSISVEEKRVRGIELVEPLLMRPVNGAELATLATGVGDGGTTKILPQCPTDVAVAVASDILGDAHPLRVRLVQHGFAARRRRHISFQWMSLILLVLGAVGHQIVLPMAEAEGELWWFLAPGLLWIPLGVVLAELSYAHLGHFLTDDHLVVGHGATARRRTVLEVDGIIGWVFDQSFFQRRLGLVTLQATTAAGAEQVTLTDIPEHLAVRLAADATREPVRPFLTGRD
ncbi:PH domain-containing protein [Nocardioides gilvus]|uniref:PH domain-containing protein n=1 Tax=Nocardioides gilvus TaxID=1735589 RepID=UPI000D741979|nr:PH domain-containing protein [Nocardioides gilvus]